MATMSNLKTFLANAAAAGLTVIAVAALAGCGPASAGGATSAGHGSGTHGRQSPAGRAGAPMRLTVCDAPSAVTSVRVTRLPAMSQLGQTKPLPKPHPGVTVRDPAKARGLARLVCSLPRLPRGVLSCPAQRGGGYGLVFTAAGRSLPPVTVQATGCESVTGTGPGGARWAARSSSFWATLSRLTGIEAPAHSP
jgi:hypothetical protein